MSSSLVKLLPVTLFALLCPGQSSIASPGATVPWVTYEAEGMVSTGTKLGPSYVKGTVELESSGQQCVRLEEPGQHVEFRSADQGNALVLRYSLPDAADGLGTEAVVAILVNGVELRRVTLSSRYALVYGAYPFNNRPADGGPHFFYDEARLKDIPVTKGDLVQVRFISGVSYCILDLVDVEQVPEPLVRPAHSLSLKDYLTGSGSDEDCTEALRRCIREAVASGSSVWLPAGSYKLTGDIVLDAPVSIQGAGMWHTRFVGDDTQYSDPKHRIRFKLSTQHAQLADFAIIGKLRYRNDDEPNDGIIGAGCEDCSVTRVWVEHTKVGFWCYNTTRLLVDSCRIRNVLADGLNLSVGTTESIVQNSSTRGTGDDCFAIWPTVSDQGYTQRVTRPGLNVFRSCTGQAPWLANGAAIYGGRGNRVEDCLFTDIATAAGVLISSTFPVTDATSGADNNFSGSTVVQRCRIIRAGGQDAVWNWRGSVQICLDQNNISGVQLQDIQIEDSLSDGVSIIGPGSGKGKGVLSDSRASHITLTRGGLAVPGSTGLRVRKDARGGLELSGSKGLEIRQESGDFELIQH
jgi:hypothetical protein